MEPTGKYLTRRLAYGQAILLALLLLALSACATTGFGKALQSSEGAKIAVETAADEVIRLHERKQVSDADYVKARGAYEKWAAAQKLYTETFVAWSRAKTAQNDSRMQAALTNLNAVLNATADAMCGAFRNSSPALQAACVQLGRS